MGVLSKLEDLEQQAIMIKTDLLAQIEGWPDNDTIVRISESPSCFIVRSSDLGDNWSPKHHDFKESYKLIIKRLDRCSTGSVRATLEDIVKKRRVIVAGERLDLHDDVIAHLNELLEEV